MLKIISHSKKKQNQYSPEIYQENEGKEEQQKIIP